MSLDNKQFLFGQLVGKYRVVCGPAPNPEQKIPNKNNILHVLHISETDILLIWTAKGK